MGKLNCICGAQISDVLCPNTVTGLLIADLDMEKADGADIIKLMNIGRGVWECYQCGRVAFDYPSRHSNTVKWYKPEDGIAGHLCASSHEHDTTPQTPPTLLPRQSSTEARG